MREIPPPPLPPWLDSALPFRRRMAEIGEHRIHFLDHGEGVPVLMLHGNPTWSFLWRKVIARLDPARFRCVAPDLFGFGLSSKPAHVSAHSVEAHARVVLELVEALDLRSAVLVGQDWGGPIGTLVAARSPERFHSLVLANTAVLAPRRPLRPSAFHRFSHVPLVSTLAFRGLGFPIPVLQRVQGDPRSLGREERRAYAWPLRRWNLRAGILATARMVPHHEGHPTLRALDETDAFVRAFKGPATLVWGTADPILGRAHKRLAEAMPGATVELTPAGHFLQEEVPDRLASAIEQVSRG